MAKKENTNQEPIEKQLWKTADKLRKNIDAAEYKHVILGLIFLKYISDAFKELHNKLLTGEGECAGADPEDRDEYQAENVFFVPANPPFNVSDWSGELLRKDGRWHTEHHHPAMPTLPGYSILFTTCHPTNKRVLCWQKER